MSKKISKTKRLIMTILYKEQILLSYNISLLAEYLQYTHGVKIGSSYLDRAMRELIKSRYVEKIKIGYNALPSANLKCYEKDTFRKTKNVYRLTRGGIAYVEEMIGEQESNRARTSLIRYDPAIDERTIRVFKTNIFGTAEMNREPRNTFISNDELRVGIKNKSALGSKVTGMFIVKDYDEREKHIPVYNTGGYLTLQHTKTEKRMTEELRKKYGDIEEGIVLGDSWLVFSESIKTLAKRERMRRENNQQDVVSPLIIESEPRDTKYFHENSEAGLEQMRIYQIPKENRREYFREKLKEKEEYQKLFTKSSVSAGRTDYLFDAITDDAYVFVGYEMDIDRVKNLYERMEATAMNTYDKGLIIICSEAQRELYTKLFKETKTREMQFLKILTTEGIP